MKIEMKSWSSPNCALFINIREKDDANSEFYVTTVQTFKSFLNFNGCTMYCTLSSFERPVRISYTNGTTNAFVIF